MPLSTRPSRATASNAASRCACRASWALRIVAQTELLVIVPRILGQILAAQEPVELVEPPFPLPAYAVKQHWHARFHADEGNAWLRQTMASLFGGKNA